MDIENLVAVDKDLFEAMQNQLTALRAQVAELKSELSKLKIQESM